MSPGRRTISVLAALAAGCLPPTAITAFTDGSLPATGQHDVAGGVITGGALDPETLRDPAVPPSAWVAGGVGWTTGVGRRVALHAGAAVSTQVYADPTLEGSELLHAQVEVQARLGPDAPLEVLLLGGIDGAVLLADEDPWHYGGFHVGALLAGEVHPNVRVHGALRFATLFDPNTFMPPPGEPEPPVGVYFWHPLTFGASYALHPRVALGAELVGVPPSWGGRGGEWGQAAPGGLGASLWLRARLGGPDPR